MPIGKKSSVFRAQKLLFDIMAAGKAVQHFARTRQPEDLNQDLQFRSAVERQLEILCEALRQLHSVDSSLANRFSEYRQIMAMRNRLVHAYDTIDHTIIWQAITEKVPVALANALLLLSEISAP